MAPVAVKTGEERRAAHRRQGAYTIRLANRPVILAAAAVGGPMEGKGPLGKRLDRVYQDRLVGQKSWEQAESRMLYDAVVRCCAKANTQLEAVDLIFSGDLLNQCISSSFAAREWDRPFVGIFGACSTFTLGIGLAAMAADGGYANLALAATSSHHDGAERQYRYPTEFGNQRPLTAQWTATGAAAVLLGTAQAADAPDGPRVAVTHVTLGRVIDAGLKDPFNMGGCMAPAAVDTIQRHFEDTGRTFADYDLVATGDLASVGHPMASELLAEAGYDPGDRFLDCGLLLYDRNRQDVHAGGSGCACSGIVFTTEFFPRLLNGEYRRLLLVSTGCLHNKLTFQQRESIPSIAHAVAFERIDEAT